MAPTAVKAQAVKQLIKLVSITRQVEQKTVEAQSITASIAEIDGAMPPLEKNRYRTQDDADSIWPPKGLSRCANPVCQVRKRAQLHQRKFAEIAAPRKSCFSRGSESCHTILICIFEKIALSIEM